MSVDMAAIREALGKATPGPWIASGTGCYQDDDLGSFVADTTHSGRVGDDSDNRVGIADAELIVLLRNDAKALLDEVERLRKYTALAWGEGYSEAREESNELKRLRAASEGVDMLVAQAERRGAVKVQQRLEEIPDEVYPESIFGTLSSDDLAKISAGIESVGYTIDSLSGHILRFGYQAAGRIAGQVIDELDDRNL